MKQRILIVLVLGFIINFSSTFPVHAKDIILNMNSLPSSQGWTFDSSIGLSEMSIYTLSVGGILEMDTIGNGWGAGSIYLQNNVITQEPFTFSVRARVLQEEILAHGPAQAIQFSVFGNGRAYYFALGPNHIIVDDGLSNSVFTSFNNTQFHDYVLQGNPGIDNSYTLTVDETLVITGTALSYNPSVNYIFFGDSSSAGNGHAEIASLNFSQDNDIDDDGISDEIDTDPESNSTSFSDGTTYGNILNNPLDFTFEVKDAENSSDGVQIDAISGTGRIVFRICDSFTVKLSAGSSIIVTCGSLGIKVLTGEVEVVVDEVGTSVLIPSISETTITKLMESIQIQNSTEAPVSITVKKPCEEEQIILISSNDTTEFNIAKDVDDDEIPDSCDACPNDVNNDIDDDGVCGDVDNCPSDSNSDQSNIDKELGDNDGDVCDDDIDGDGELNTEDNCVFDYNDDQRDIDEDGAGDVCDDDIDGDGVLDAEDQCVPTSTGEVVDATGCSIAEHCPCVHPVGGNKWKNHGSYVSCVAHATEDFFEAGLISEAEKDAIVSEAGESTCGHKNK